MFGPAVEPVATHCAPEATARIRQREFISAAESTVGDKPPDDQVPSVPPDKVIAVQVDSLACGIGDEARWC